LVTAVACRGIKVAQVSTVQEGKQVAEKTAVGGGKILLVLLSQFEQLWQNELKLNYR
jgi:hypothetical protein